VDRKHSFNVNETKSYCLSLGQNILVGLFSYYTYIYAPKFEVHDVCHVLVFILAIRSLMSIISCVFVI
jgi:hypothetical protein